MDSIQIDCAFPGGNIIVDDVQTRGNRVVATIRQDLRDTEGHWFYWYFRVRGAAETTVRFQFTDGKAIGVYGPAISLDGAATWTWLGAESVDGESFTYAFPSDAHDVRFSVGIPYVENDLARWLAARPAGPHLAVDKLCDSEKGRAVERIRLGNLGGDAKHKVLVTCRHHCCEAVSSFVLEGLMDAVLAPTPQGDWLRDNVEIWAIPFVDKDGVEDGDQGKNRRPHDHNRDYEAGLYAPVRALRSQVPQWAAGRLRVALDLHCPYLNGISDETIYMVGSKPPAVWQEQMAFSQILHRLQSSPLPFDPKDNMPYGQGWNTDQNYRQGKSFGQWAGEIPGMRLTTTLEFPYANVSGKVVSANRARHFGRDVAAALQEYLAGLTP